MSNAIELQNVTYIYGENTSFCKVAVDDVSFSIKEGRVTGIIGHTGSGKSTLVQMFNGLLTPTSGTVSVFGQNIFADKKSLYQARFQVGLVFQYPEYQLFEETVEKDVAFGPKNRKLDAAEIDRLVKSSIDFVGLDRSLLSKSPFELSGGQKRRVAIAGILAMNPRILVLDEPASGLDPIGREEIFSGLKNFQQETAATIVIVSHSMEDMAKYADDVLVMNHGKLFLSDSKENIFSHADELLSVGLDVPQITRYHPLTSRRLSSSRQSFHGRSSHESTSSSFTKRKKQKQFLIFSFPSRNIAQRAERSNATHDQRHHDRSVFSGKLHSASSGSPHEADSYGVYHRSYFSCQGSGNSSRLGTTFLSTGSYCQNSPINHFEITKATSFFTGSNRLF
jgi:energy-coupling factor transport system ATP-binding protein